MSVQVVHKSGEGLSRVFAVTVPKDELAGQLEAKIAEIRPNMNLKGFRPGKVPASHVKKMYGRQLMQEIVDKAVNDASTQALDQAKARPAAQPDIKLESDIEQVVAGKADLAFDLDVELMPDFEPADLAGMKLERPTYAAPDDEIEAQITEIAATNKSFETKAGKSVKAADGDMVVADFKGSIDGELFEGGSADDAEIVIGSNRFIPGFEDGVKGAKVGETRTVEVTFPEGYAAEQLAGKAAAFEVTIKEIKAPKADETVDDAFAERLGMPSLQALKDAIRGQLESQYAGASRQKLKRALLDALDTRHSFDLPPRMVESEFATIWGQVEQERASGEISEEDAGKSDEDLRAEYRKIAERRVRLGLVLAEIGRRANVEITDQEMQGALFAEARKYPGQEREVIQFFQQNQQAAAGLRAPLYEEKVVDHLISVADVTDKAVSKEELFAEDDMPAAYADEGEAKPKAKAKAAPKAKAAKADAPEPKSEELQTEEPKADKPKAEKKAAKAKATKAD